MRKYLQISFRTLTGIRTFIDLGDFSNGEWIINDHNIPKYHVGFSDVPSSSNKLLLSLLNSKAETIESILKKINKRHNTRLSLGKRPLGIIKKEEHIELDLTPLPDHWLENI